MDVVWAIKQFRIYVYGTRFKVVTDHSALMWMGDPVARLARWAIYLQAYDFEIIHLKGLIHSNSDTLSRPVLSVNTIRVDDSEANVSAKALEPYDDDALMHFLRYKRHLPGLSANRIKNTEKLTKHLELSINNLGKEQLWHIKEKGEKVKVPLPAEREDIILRAHLLGHFQVESTLKRLQNDFHWKKMEDDVKRVVESCEVCRLYQKQSTVQHPARAIKTGYVHCMIGIDLVLGFPESQKGHVGLLVITEYLTKYPYVKAIKNKSAKEMDPICTLVI